MAGTGSIIGRVDNKDFPHDNHGEAFFNGKYSFVENVECSMNIVHFPKYQRHQGHQIFSYGFCLQGKWQICPFWRLIYNLQFAGQTFPLLYKNYKYKVPRNCIYLTVAAAVS